LHLKPRAGVVNTLESPFRDTLRDLDDQITETRQLCQRINAAIRRENDPPYFPERRDRYEPYKPDRRCHDYWSLVETHLHDRIEPAALPSSHE
jgi:hypothetical protein